MRFCGSKVVLLLLFCVSLNSCDFFRKVAGRPTSADIEKKRSAILMEQKAHDDRIDSLKMVQRQISDSLAILDSIRMLSSSLVEARQLSDDERGRLPHAYYIVVGAFANQGNAGKFADKAVNAGYQATMIRYRNGFTAVGICPSDRITDAYHALKQVRESGFCPDAWILNNR